MRSIINAAAMQPNARKDPKTIIEMRAHRQRRKRPIPVAKPSPARSIQKANMPRAIVFNGMGDGGSVASWRGAARVRSMAMPISAVKDEPMRTMMAAMVTPVERCMMSPEAYSGERRASIKRRASIARAPLKPGTWEVTNVMRGSRVMYKMR